MDTEKEEEEEEKKSLLLLNNNDKKTIYITYLSIYIDNKIIVLLLLYFDII